MKAEKAILDIFELLSGFLSVPTRGARAIDGLSMRSIAPPTSRMARQRGIPVQTCSEAVCGTSRADQRFPVPTVTTYFVIAISIERIHF